MNSDNTANDCTGLHARAGSPQRTTKAPRKPRQQPAPKVVAQPPAAAPQQPPAGRAWHQPVQLAFEQWRMDTHQWRAHGGRHIFRIVCTGEGVFHAWQKGVNGTFTPVGGQCATRAQAEDLAQRYENGAPQLSHRQYRELPYDEAVAKLAQ